ncbi:MAG: hypothetical protein RIS47_2335 [Bacteroidota bacterium]|jgi:hypothetical protein
MPKIYFLLRTKGTSRIPDFLQIRDENFVLLSHTRADKAESAIEEAGLSVSKVVLMDQISTLNYGVMKQIEL